MSAERKLAVFLMIGIVMCFIAVVQGNEFLKVGMCTRSVVVVP